MIIEWQPRPGSGAARTMRGRTRTERDLQYEGYCELIAKVYRQALKEAQRGRLDAIGWLDIVAPDWRERCKTMRKQ